MCVFLTAQASAGHPAIKNDSLRRRDWPDFKSYAVQRTHISTERVLCASDQSKSAYSGDAVRFPATLSLAETSSLTIRSNTYAAR